jgi:hypothetical protein
MLSRRSSSYSQHIPLEVPLDVHDFSAVIIWAATASCHRAKLCAGTRHVHRAGYTCVAVGRLSSTRTVHCETSAYQRAVTATNTVPSHTATTACG